jgi:hypothetical protein
VSVIQTVLVYVGIPALILAVLAALTLGPGMVKAPRYRPGEPWDYAPVWYLPRPEHLSTPSAGSGHAALEGGHPTPALTAGEATRARAELGVTGTGDTAPTARGGVHDTW